MFCKNWWQLLAVNYFHKMLHIRRLTGFWICLWKYVDSSLLTFLSSLYTVTYWLNKILLEYMGQVFKKGPSKICGRQPLKKFEVIWSAWADHITWNFLKTVFHKFYFVYSLIPWPVFCTLTVQCDIWERKCRKYLWKSTF